MKALFSIHPIFFVVTMLALGSFFIFTPEASAATRTWDGGGGDNDWSTCANWSDDTCPVAGDTALFNSTDTSNAIIDTDFSLRSLTVDALYTGEITQQANLDIEWHITISGGTYTWSSGDINIQRNLTHSGGTLALTGATMTFDSSAGTDDSVLTCTGTLSGSVDIDKSTSGATFTLAAGCTANLVDSVSTSGGATLVYGTLNPGSSFVSTSSLYTYDAGVMTFDTGDTLSVTTLNIDGTITLPNVVTVNNIVTTSDGEITAPGTAIDLSGYFTNAGTFNFPNGTDFELDGNFNSTGTITGFNGTDISFKGSNDANITCNGTGLQGADLIVNKSLSFRSLRFLSDCTIGSLTQTLGGVNTTGGPFTVTFYKGLAASSSSSINSSVEILFTGTDTQDISDTGSGSIGSDITINKAGGSVVLQSDFHTTGECVVEAGTLNENGFTLTCDGGFSVLNTNPDDPASLGPASLVDGSSDNDNTPTPTFTLSDDDGADQVRYQIQIDDSSDFSSVVVDYTSALQAQGATSFTVGQVEGGGSYTTGSGGQTLTNTSFYWRVKAIDENAAESSYSTANGGAVAFAVDAIAPTVEIFSPVDDATNVAVDANLVVDFDENITVGTGDIRIYESDDTLIDTIDISDPEVTVVTDTLTINPTSDLDEGISYYVQVDSGAVEDAVGNDYSGISDETTWSFSMVPISYNGGAGGGLPSVSVKTIEEPQDEDGSDETNDDEVKSKDISSVLSKLMFVNSAFSVGEESSGIKGVQIMLNTLGYELAESGPGSLGSETSYFGERTRAAIMLFKCENSLTCNGLLDEETAIIISIKYIIYLLNSI